MTTAGRTPLHNAALERSGLLQQLLAQGADVNATDAMQRTPLHNACQKFMHEHVPALLAAGADVAARDANGMTPLHYAASSGFHSALPQLLDAGAEPDYRDDKGHTALFHAVAQNQGSCVDVLLRAGADPGIADLDGETAFDHLHPMMGTASTDTLWREDARRNGPGRILRHLCGLIDADEFQRILNVLSPARCPAKYATVAERAPLPLLEWHALADALSDYCAANRAWHSLLALETSGLPVCRPAVGKDLEWTWNSTYNLGTDPVAWKLISDAADCGEGVPLLLRLEPEGCRPVLDVALLRLCASHAVARVGGARQEQIKALALAALTALIDAGANIEANNKTAAARVCEALGLQLAADGWVVAPDEGAGDSPLRLVATLIKDVQRPLNFTPLLMAAESGNMPLIDGLITSGADVTAADGFGRNALHLVCASSHLHASASVVSRLLNAGIDPESATANGLRPLCLAVRSDVVRALLDGGASPELSDDDRQRLGPRNYQRLREWIAAARTP